MDSEDISFGRPQPRTSRWKPFVIVVAIVVVIAAVAWWLAHTTPATSFRGRFGRGGHGAEPGGMAMPVGVAKAAKGDIDIVLDSLGTVTPLRVVTVSAQVAGQLRSVNFREGQHVAQGDLLAEIDPRPFQAALMQAEGTEARDRALLANAKIDLERYKTLFAQDSIAHQQLDSQASLVRQYEGTLKSDHGQIATAKVNLAYTKITAPIPGRVGLRQVDPGNNVQNGSAIVVITQEMPIDVLFTIAQDNLPAVLEKMHRGTRLAVDAYDRTGQKKLASGSLASLDNQIDTATGTVKAKAEFANADEGLFPNQFVNVRLLLDVMHDATVIPSSALERGSVGLFVYVVQPDHTVAVRGIETGPTQGELVAVTEGLQVGEQVVTSGADRLRAGSRVLLPDEEPAPPARPAASGDGQRRQWKRADGQAGQHKPGERRLRDGRSPGGPESGPAARSGGAPANGPDRNGASSTQHERQ